MDNSQDPANNQSSARSGSSATIDSGESKSATSTPTRKQAKNDTRQEQMNGTDGTAAQGLLSESHEILKSLPLDEVLNTAKTIVGELDKLEDYQRGEGMRYQKILANFYWDYSSHRHAIGDALNDCGYAALTMKMLKTTDALEIVTNDDIWFFTYYTYTTAWNYSDASAKLAKSLAEADAVRLLTFNLGHKPYLSAMESKNVYYVLKASLSTLHNIARSPDVRHYFKENNTAEVIMPFISQKDEFLKAIAMLILAYIAEEEDNTRLICDTGTIVNIGKWLDLATENAVRRRFRGFAPWELTQGLNKLAVNDTNKIKVIEAGALSVFLKMLQHDDPKEQEVTGHCLWTLAFDKTSRDKIKEYEGLVPALESLAKGDQPAVKKAVEGALWIIKGKNNPSPRTRTKAMKSKSHVFISYSWDEKDIVKQIREKLRMEGYKVWIDYEQMGGSTLQDMAEAVENAAVVLVCMSEKYKESRNCRTEADYMFQLRKAYIPLMVQKKYRPNGWLGAILGTKLFFDFSGKYPFNKTMQGLLKELRGRGQFSRSMDSEAQDQLSESSEVLKNLPLEEVLKRAKAIVGELNKLEDYHRGEGTRYQKILNNFHSDYFSNRHVIGDALSDCGYAALTVKMLKTMNSLGIFKNDDIWLFTFYTYSTAWNYSDSSEKMAKSLAEAGAVRLLTSDLRRKPYLSSMENKNVYHVLQASLSILHNIARSPGVRHYFKENKTAEVIMPFTSQKDEFLKAVAMLTLAYIAEEEDNAHLICDTGTIVQLVKWLEKATEKAGERSFKGFAPWELTQGLDKLAVNDTNKMKVIEAGALSVFLKMLQHDDPKEQAVTGHCLWTLAFDKTARNKIKEYEGLVPALESLAKGDQPAVKKAVEGALWIIKGENDSTISRRTKSTMKSKNHIFISYSWNEKDIVEQIREKLRTEGYKVWIDYEQMEGSTLQAMAEAVENAAVVLVCMSEKYKESANCRTEAEYMFQLHKAYIPLILQKKYNPNGWLGILLGAKLFFDFSGKYPFDKTMTGLLKELRSRKHFSRSRDSVDGPGVKAVEAAASTPVHSENSPKVPSHPATSDEAHNMTRDDVTQWLIRHQLDICTTPMAQLDGKLLWQLKVIRNEAPQFFFQFLDTKLNLSFVDLLKFTAAIDELH